MDRKRKTDEEKEDSTTPKKTRTLTPPIPNTENLERSHTPPLPQPETATEAGPAPDALMEKESRPLPPPEAVIIDDWNLDSENNGSLLVARNIQHEAEVEKGIKRHSWREENNIVTIDSGSEEEGSGSSSGDN